MITAETPGQNASELNVGRHRSSVRLTDWWVASRYCRTMKGSIGWWCTRYCRIPLQLLRATGHSTCLNRCGRSVALVDLRTAEGWSGRWVGTNYCHCSAAATDEGHYGDEGYEDDKADDNADNCPYVNDVWVRVHGGRIRGISACGTRWLRAFAVVVRALVLVDSLT